MATGLRQQIDELVNAGHWQRAAQQLRVFWERESTGSLAGYVVSTFERMKGQVELTAYRCAILRSFTVEPIAPVLKACALTSGIDLAVHVGEFNAYAQEILDSGSPLYRFEPATVILAVQTRDVAPDLWRNATHETDRVVNQFGGWVREFRARSNANLIIHGLERPAIAAHGVYDGQVENNQGASIDRVNRELRELAREYRGVFVLDYDSLVARHGRERWGDERKWLTVRLPIAAANLGHMAREWMRFLAPLTGKVAKAVAVDLDNTLWGGIIGEDGISGIQASGEYPGASYQNLQRALLDLTQRGILLAVCSKNNAADAMEALATHPGMLLRPEHFAAMRINWNDKAQNLREIAAELNIGLDAIAFLDDNPVERQQVREQAPEVMVLELPADPMEYARSVRDYPAFERLSLSEEDRHRNLYYAAERQRVALEESVSSREDFLRSLEQEAEIAPVHAMTLARVAQLTQKTNQFNLTTKRYTEQQISEMARCAEWRVLSIKVRDRYADNGLVGVAIVHHQGELSEVDTFLLSCRVIGRTVETALLAELAEEARSRGAKRLGGWFRPTKKNAPAMNFYADHGFTLSEEKVDGQWWELDLTTGGLQCPEWVRLVSAVAEPA
jgi:FkbH-like protein